MTESTPASPRPANRTADRTLRGATITIAVVSMGLSGVLTWEAANSSLVNASGTGTAVAPDQQPTSQESDDNPMPSSAGPPLAAAGGQPVAVSGGS